MNIKGRVGGEEHMLRREEQISLIRGVFICTEWHHKLKKAHNKFFVDSPFYL